MKTGKLYLLGLLALLSLTCERRQTGQEPVLIFQNPAVVVENLIANNLILPHFVPGGQEIVFSGRLEGDLWDAIYQVPVVGGMPQKIYGINDDLLYPSFSPDQRQVIFSRGLARQIHLLNIVTKDVTPLPIFGNYPSILPDGNTILYVGVLDANVRLYDLREGQQRTLTSSHLAVNFFPMMTRDRSGVIWYENRTQEQVRVNQTDFEALDIDVLQIFREPLLGWTVSPSGEWAIASRPNGQPFGFKIKDTTRATIAIQPDDPLAKVKHLAYSVDWSPTGRQVAYIGHKVPQFSYDNPFTHLDTYRGDLVVADLRWENIGDAEVLQSPPLNAQPIFQYKEQAAPSEPRFVPAEINNPPVIISTPLETVWQGELYFYRVQAVEIDLFDELYFTLVSGPTNAEILSRIGVLAWLPADTGLFEFTVTVEDSRTGMDSQTFYVNVLPEIKWDQVSYQSGPVDKKTSDFAAGLRFLDTDGDGFLTPGEEAALQIDLKPLRDEPLDSLRLQLIYSATIDEIEFDNEVIFRDCQHARWNRQVIPIKGLPKLQNRRILIRGILETKYGIQMLPANLIINGKNPEKNQ